MHTWEDGDLDWTETEEAPAPGLGGFWAAWVPASAPAPAQARKSLAGKKMPPWVHSTQRPAAASQVSAGPLLQLTKATVSHVSGAWDPLLPVTLSYVPLRGPQKQSRMEGSTCKEIMGFALLG